MSKEFENVKAEDLIEILNDIVSFSKMGYPVSYSLRTAEKMLESWYEKNGKE